MKGLRCYRRYFPLPIDILLWILPAYDCSAQREEEDNY
jgi:hypothetical protein